MSANTVQSAAPQPLLVPLDGSPAAESVLPAAVTLAQRLPAPVSLLHTIERDAPEQVHGERHLTDEAEARAYLAGIAERLRAEGLEVDWHVHVVPVGDVARSIATHATVRHAALILLSTHAVTDPRTWLMGAVAQGVVRHATVPVLLLRTGPRRQAASFAPREVMVTIDPARQGEAVLPAARRLARALDVPLRLLAVVPTVDTVPGDQAAAARLIPSGAAAALDLEAQATADHLTALLQEMRATTDGLPVVAEVARGDPAQVITREAREHQSVIALATHGRAGLTALWSASVGGRVIARAAGPFLLVHPDEG